MSTPPGNRSWANSPTWVPWSKRSFNALSGLNSSVPLLTAVFTMVGLLGAHLVAVELLGVDVGAYWQQLQQAMDFEDVREGIVKSVVFGVVASLLAVWEGYNAVPTAEGVGRATTRTVVSTAIAVLILDFMITAYLL